MIPSQKIILALDTKDETELNALLKEIQGQDIWLKVGMEFFYAFGAEKVNDIAKNGQSIFLDLKLHDIPNTVYEAIRSLSHLPVKMINVHCTGGLEMMKKAKEATQFFTPPPLLIGVTILTSFSEETFKQTFPKNEMNPFILELAKLAKTAGLDGVVCSPHEIQKIKEACGINFLTVTPGIRFETSSTDDQKRTLNALEAHRQGTDFMVIGRPITKASSPRLALTKILLGENP